ncbi:MAG TPA: helicase C-terminal domain-containing protein [Pyrinomonadaceae bacterium]|nr:DEAD/DEAH box helicase [Chloracidobacterium sp.]MBP9934814.1 DEAD/DEAH box helicase [Pyrinomonadaceae bacterium]MBL0240927.1 DEAD/DEAH box helicase [Chloracidobacterium sp.]HQX55944.1 helicase C-terminal domain-containing protein [Pyrinomonadaceae bacterium]HQY66299.1 helicase C-terminal domain-containing protein [Pyrinomonadaceae bacterium]
MTQTPDDKIFGADGLISQFHDKYEYREGQVRMAAAIATAFEDKKHLIVEAGTGTGKTLAYLIPAIAASIKHNRRIIISTGTKNLQEQLMEKDIPFLQKILPTKFTAAYMKGRSNYACLYRINKSDDQPILDGIDEVDHFAQVREWSRETQTGDRAELTYLPENLSFWSRVNAKSETCIGQKCPDFEPCFITRMRSRAESADIVIVNHHLFFADLNVRGNQFGKVLPDYGAVIFDEAHLIEDIAADYFGFQTSNYQFDEVARDATNLPIADAIAIAGITKAAGKVVGLAEQFWARFTQGRGGDGRFPLLPDTFAIRGRDGKPVPSSHGEAYHALDDALSRLENDVDVFSEKLPEADSLVRRIRQGRFDLEFIIKQADANYVYWLERRGRGVFLQASPVDVSSLLQDKLFDKVETCVLTSATLSTNGGFSFIRNRLGLSAGTTNTLVAPSSFDYQSQAIVYLPKAMPDPRSPEFTQMAAAEIVNILHSTQGRAFVLCTSNSSMKALYEIVSSRVGYPCFLQGTMSKTGLLERFRGTSNAVLFATSSFWQGVDVQGDQLSCVIIDKLPFAVPTDPLVAARSKFIDDNGGRSFFDYSVPQAVISLKQGIGRLIRSSTDRGVIAILDPRLRTKPYGRDFLASLPRMRITSDIEDVRSMFDAQV